MAYSVSTPSFEGPIDLLLHFDLAVQRGVAASSTGRDVAGGLWVRIADAVNVLFLLVPLWPVGAAAAFLLARQPRDHCWRQGHSDVAG